MGGETGERADLGLLLVHGIGRQKAGGAVDEVANALLGWLVARGRPAEVVRARLKDKDAPAQATLLVPDAAGGAPHRLLLVESFWAEEFDPPGFLDVLRWMLGPGAWLLFRHVVGLPRRLGRRTLQLRPATLRVVLASAAHLGRQPAWLDLYATDDFVPAGPLLARAGYRRDGDGLWRAPETASLGTARIVNQRNPLKDHTAYWANAEGFIDPLMAWLNRACGLAWLPSIAPATGWRDRRWRAWLRYGMSLALLLLAVALWWRAAPVWREALPGLDKVASWLAGQLPVPVAAAGLPVGGPLLWLWVTVAYVVALAAHVAALSLYETLVTGPVWRSLDRQLSLDPPRDRRGWLKAGGRLAAYLFLVGLTAAALLEAVQAGGYRPLVEVPADLLLAVHRWLFL